MIPTILVDDEYMILRGLQKLIDWQELGFDIVSTFQDPNQALQFVRQTHPQLLITDMNMPEIDGPDFIAQVRSAQPDIAIIVLSGYGDFEYVRAGLQNGALDYLRKPVDPDELTAALTKARKELSGVAKRREESALAQQQQLQHVLVTATGYQNTEIMQDLGLQSPDEHVELRVVAILNPDRKLLEAFLARSPAVVGYFWEQQDAILLLSGTWPNVRHWLSTMPAGIGPTRRPVVISPPVMAPAELHRQYTAVLHAGQIAYFYQAADGLVVIPQTAAAPPKLPIPALDWVADQLATMDLNQMEDEMLTLYEQITKQQVSVAYARQLGLVFLMALNSRTHHALPHYEEYVSQINNADTVSGLTKTLGAAILTAKTVQNTNYSASVQQVVDIIQHHYHEPVQITDIADELHLNAVYLGQLFKKETGQTFSQYLADWRINRAKSLLRQGGLDIGLIAEEVGYQNNGYFYKVFKKQVGVSPRVYREQERQIKA